MIIKESYNLVIHRLCQTNNSHIIIICHIFELQKNIIFVFQYHQLLGKQPAHRKVKTTLIAYKLWNMLCRL